MDLPFSCHSEYADRGDFCRANVHYKIGVIHSYEKGYHDAERYHQTLEKELSTVGIKAEINDLFLNCDELRYEDELVRASFLSMN